MRWLGAMVVVAVALVAPRVAAAATHEVGANGNIFTGGLSFTPALTKGDIGDVVRWTNTDAIVPHTATERNGLWDLTGTYGATPLNPPGFGPGDARERTFEAGSFDYYCAVHPVEMNGVVAVAPDVRRVTTAAGRHRLLVVWAVEPPAEGQAFDVERRLHGEWTMVRDGTTKPSARFAGKHGRFRARLRLAADPAIASGWSPTAKR